MLCPLHARGKVDNILLPYMQKSHEPLADARKSIRKSIENKQWTAVAVLCQRHDFILLHHFFYFFVF